MVLVMPVTMMPVTMLPSQLQLLIRRGCFIRNHAKLGNNIITAFRNSRALHIPTSQRAAILESAGSNYTFSVREVPVPQPGPGEILVKLSVSGVCETDFTIAQGYMGPPRSILGHEGIGRVVKLGLGVNTRNVRLGQRVGVGFQRDACGQCVMCLEDGGETRCIEQQISGLNFDGTFAEYTIVPAKYLNTIPEGPSDEDLAPIMCSGVTAYKALKTICSHLTPGSWVAVIGGAGGVGSMCIQYARSMGHRVIAIDTGEEKRQYCEKLGATAFLDFAFEDDIGKTVQELTGGLKARAAIVAAGSHHAYNTGISTMGPYGTLVCVGVPPPGTTAIFSPQDCVGQGHRIIGTAVGTRGDVREAVEFVRRGTVKPHVHMTSLNNINDVSDKLHSGQVIGKYVLQIN